MLRPSDGERRASSDLRKGNTEGSVSRPQLNNRHTEMFFSKAECFRAFSMTGQYLKNIAQSLQHSHQLQPNWDLVLLRYSPVPMSELGSRVIFHDRHVYELSCISDGWQNGVEVWCAGVWTERRWRGLRSTRDVTNWESTHISLICLCCEVKSPWCKLYWVHRWDWPPADALHWSGCRSWTATARGWKRCFDPSPSTTGRLCAGQKPDCWNYKSPHLVPLPTRQTSHSVHLLHTWEAYVSLHYHHHHHLC